MTPKLTFSARDLKRGLSVAKLVKPSSNDFMIRFKSNMATICSTDKRRVSMVNVMSTDTEDVPEGWVSDEYCIPAGKLVLFEAGLDTVTFSVTENSMTIQASGGKQSRKATIKRRIDSTRRSLIPNLRWGELSLVHAKKFSKLLRMVGCSALVKETKTDEEMRINQVHFNSALECASSNARYHASIGYLPGMHLDLSIIGSDIPTICSFCSMVEGDVGLFQDKNKLYVVDQSTNSVLAMGRVSSAKQDLSPPSDDFSTEVMMDKAQLMSGLDWAMAALDGTQRLLCDISDGNMSMNSGNTEVFAMPVSVTKGPSLHAEFPARFFRSVVDHVESDQVLVKFGHSASPTIIEISGVQESSDVVVRHYMQIMKARNA